MVDPPNDEVASLLAAGPEEFVAARTARARALRAEGRREDAAALAKVRKPVRLTWLLIDVQRSQPSLVEAAVDAAEALEAAQAGGGERVRPLLLALRQALEEVAASVDGDGAQAGLAARLVVADAAARQAWAEGRLLALPEADADAEGGSPPTRERRAARRPRHTAGKEADDRAPAEDVVAAKEEADAERARRRAEAAQRADEQLRAAEEARAAAADALAEREAVVARLDEEIARLQALREEARDEEASTRQELAARVAAVDQATAARAAIKADPGG